VSDNGRCRAQPGPAGVDGQDQGHRASEYGRKARRDCGARARRRIASFNKAPREIRIGGDDRRHGFVSDLARYRDDREEVSCYRTPADDVPMNSSFWKEASTEAADAQVGVAAAVAVAQPRRLPVSPSVRSTWLSAAVTAALQGTAVSILSADAYGYGMICGMSKALTRDQTAALAASLAVVMERIRAEELGASAAATYRWRGRSSLSERCWVRRTRSCPT
jgi:hypothetical protein